MSVKPSTQPASPTLFVNARILTEDPGLPLADAMLVDGERFTWVGELTALPAALHDLAAQASVVDLGGARVIPGFVDAHMHAVMLANFAPQVSCLPPQVRSIEDIVAKLADRRAARKQQAEADAAPLWQPGEAWIEGWGYDESLLAERRSPTRWDLDRGCPDMPVCITRSCGHIRCVNSMALRLAGIGRDTPDPEGGQIERGEDGEPTGVLRESARDLVTPLIPKPSEADVVRRLVDLGDLLASQGIVATTDLCSLDGSDTYGPLCAAAERGLAQDVACYVLWDDLQAATRAGAGGAPGFGPSPFAARDMDRARQVFLAGVKLLTDGSVSGRTAWFDEPYLPREAADSGDCGMPTCTDEELVGAIDFCRSHGCQLSLHAMGTRAVSRAARALVSAGPWPLAGGRNEAPCARVEHVTDPSPESVEVLARSGVGVVTQPIFPYAEVSAYLANLGPRRTRRCYPLRTMLDAGVRLCLSTDAPATSWATPSDPFVTIKAAVTRRACDGSDLGQNEALSVDEALALYTREAARMVGFEGLGVIRAGYKASFVVLDRDILDTPPDEIDQIRVARTYIRGRVAFEQRD